MKNTAIEKSQKTAVAKPGRRADRKRKRRSALLDFLCALPALILLAVFTYYPIAQLVRISFTDWNLLSNSYSYVGLKNWIWLFTGTGAKYFGNSLKVTLLYSAGELTIVLIGGMIFALIFSGMSKGFQAMRAIVFMPRYIAMSSAAVVYIWLLQTDGGVINYLLGLFGLPAVDWLGKTNTALLSVLMLTGWRSIGYGMMIYLAAMMGISKEYYEAASLDGANKVQQFFKITLPMLSPTILFLLVTQFISSMKVFQSVDVMTSGGPYRSTEVFVYLIYRYAMEDFRMDRAATAAVAFFVMLLVVTVATMKVSKGTVNYDA